MSPPLFSKKSRISSYPVNSIVQTFVGNNVMSHFVVYLICNIFEDRQFYNDSMGIMSSTCKFQCIFQKIIQCTWWCITLNNVLRQPQLPSFCKKILGGPRTPLAWLAPMALAGSNPKYFYNESVPLTFSMQMMPMLQHCMW